MYRLKQAPRAWYNRLDAFFSQNHFDKSENEPTLYIKRVSKAEYLVVCVYVDDIIYVSPSERLLSEFRAKMMQEFEMTDLGRLNYFLVLEVNQTEEGISVSQQKYARDLLKRFKM